jgi:hypothetical protein
MKKAPKANFHKKFPRGKTRWLRVMDMPFSRSFTYDLIDQGFLFSVELQLPGSRRSIRLIDGESLDSYLLKLGKKQREGATT